jgi:glyoxylase-like metal-dependent hydrolase (beta-lactamase superfamily II)
MGMEKIIDGIYTVKGLPVGRVYVIEAADGLTVIDATIAGQLPKIEKGLAAINRTVADVKRILITHAHPDHIGSLAALQKASGAKVYVGAKDAHVVRGAPVDRPSSASLTGLKRFLATAMPTPKLEAAPVDRELHEGDVLDEVTPGLTVIAEPGHSPGQVGFWLPSRKLLFAGDVVMLIAGFRLPLSFVTIDMDQAKQSIRKVAAMNPDILCCGHGAPLFNAAPGLRDFAAKLAQ